MKLDKIILVNWGALSTQEYPMGNMTLLTGPTGSGKSTMLDALQTVMTAAYQGIFSYNPGQDETNQNARNGKTKRTLWSYIVGAEDNLYARPGGAHGYIAAVFKPSEGEEGVPFTALVAAAARVDGAGNRRQAVHEKMSLLIIDDAVLSLADLVDYQDGGMQVRPVEKIDGHLNLKFSKRVCNYRDVKREYLCQLYGRFRGKKGSVSFQEAEQAARAWSQSIAHKPIGSVDDLVKTQILEHDPQALAQRISEISGLMRQVSGLRADGERLRDNIGRLERIAQASYEAMTSYQTALQYQLVNSKRSLREDERQETNAIAVIEEQKEKIAFEQQREKLLTKDKTDREDSKIRLMARLSGIPAAEQKQRLSERMTAAKGTAKSSISLLISSIAAANALQSTARQVMGSDYPADMRALETSASKVGEALAQCASLTYAVNEDVLNKLSRVDDWDSREVLGIDRAFDGANAKFKALFDALTSTENSFVAALHEQISKNRGLIEEAEKRVRDTAARKANLAQGGADYPSHILSALNDLRGNLPGARAQVLCDLIEPAGTDWQAAIEGYMGGARFNFIVEQDWEARAINYMRERNLKGVIIQGSLCLRQAREGLVPADSVIHELLTEHPIARAYLVEQYGSVVKVDDAETLRHTSRGLTRDGKGSGGRAMFATEVKNLVFGKEAKRLARERAEQTHDEAEADLSALRTRHAGLQALLGMVGRSLQPDFSASAALETAVRDIEAIQTDLARLDLTEVAELEAQVDALSVEIRGIDKSILESHQLVGSYKNEIRHRNEDLTKLAAMRETKQARINDDNTRLRNLCMANGALSFTTLEDEVDAMLAADAMSASEIQSQPQQRLVSAQSYLGTLRESLFDYNANARTEERFDTFFGVEVRSQDFAPIYAQLVVLSNHVREQLGRQRDIGLVRNLEQLRVAESSFKDVFTKQFCYEIRNLVDIGVATLRSLNTELDKLKFGTDKFRIDWSEWVPEFKEYYDFFKAAYEISDNQEAGDLFGETELSADNCKVRDRLASFLLSDDQDRALKELQRIADYRNYRRYEIWKESETGSRVALSDWGTGSGGQLETPAYIVRAAVVTNRLKHFDRGMSLKLVVNDESFAKMDERRARDVIKFMRDHLDIQLVCAMPTKHAGAIRPEFTKEWSFSRTTADGNGEVDFISEPDERDLKPDNLRVLWDEQRERVRLQAQISFEEAELKTA